MVEEVFGLNHLSLISQVQGACLGVIIITDNPLLRVFPNDTRRPGIRDILRCAGRSGENNGHLGHGLLHSGASRSWLVSWTPPLVLWPHQAGCDCQYNTSDMFFVNPTTWYGSIPWKHLSESSIAIP